MRVTFWGTANARGVPVYGCECPVCVRARRDPRMVRRCSCVEVRSGRERYVIDAGREDLSRLVEKQPPEAILLSHFDEDHIRGLPGFGWSRSTQTVVFGPDDPDREPLVGEGKRIDFRPTRAFEAFELSEVTVKCLPLRHGRPTQGFLITSRLGRRLAYLSDTCGLSEPSRATLSAFAPEVLIVDANDCGQDKEDPTHNNWDAVSSIRAAARPRVTFLFHLSDRSIAWLEAHRDRLPEDVRLSQDGMSLKW